MRIALAEAQAASEADEVPIGAVLVVDGAVIATGRNRVEELQDASAHAEMLCMRAASQRLHSWRLSNSTLYCSVEPCPMCAAALQAFRVDEIVYGTTNPRLGAFESDMAPPQSQPSHPYHPTLRARGGVLAEEAAALMRAFFRRARTRTPYGSPVADD